MGFTPAGVNFAGLLKAYPALEDKFSSGPYADNVRLGLGLKAVPSQLSLLRQAKTEYVAAEQQSPTNLARARSLNNQVDVLLTFLHRIHVKNELDPKIIRDETDRQFLEDELAIKIPDKTVDLAKLSGVLNGFSERLREALKLSQEPEIYFTQAQALSIGGQLGEKFKLNDYWGNSESVGQEALENLRIAASMQMQKRHFERSAAEQFHLEWLWTRPKLVTFLEQLSQQ